jgi:hypothetical protein
VDVTYERAPGFGAAEMKGADNAEYPELKP